MVLWILAILHAPDRSICQRDEKFAKGFINLH
jgi:hypothetical protein